MTEELKDAYGSSVSQIVAAIEDELTRYEGHKGEDDWQRESAAVRMVLYRVREVAKLTAEKVNPTACDLDVSPWQCPNCYSGSGECTAKQSPDSRTIDKAMVKRLAIQHGLLTGWQPIETAPKDKEIWAFNGEQGRMLWSEGNQWALWVWADELLSDVDPEPNQPTHWQPLPEAPTGVTP